MNWKNKRQRGFRPAVLKLKHGFTLAEVLITLGIIGIVAVMTIPTLITFIRIERYSISLKKAISTLGQAALTGIANFDLDYAAAGTPCSANGGSESPTRVYSFCALFNSTTRSRYMGSLDSVPYVVTFAQVEGQSAIPEDAVEFDNNLSNYIGYEFAEGSMFGFRKNAGGCNLDKETLSLEWIKRHPQCIGFVDVTGLSGPNRVVNCDEIHSSIINVGKVCEVPFDTQHWTDIYPVVFHNASAVPITPAGLYVLQKTKGTTSTDVAEWIEHEN